MTQAKYISGSGVSFEKTIKNMKSTIEILREVKRNTKFLPIEKPRGVEIYFLGQ